MIGPKPDSAVHNHKKRKYDDDIQPLAADEADYSVPPSYIHPAILGEPGAARQWRFSGACYIIPANTAAG
jgi:hypothetical protein